MKDNIMSAVATNDSNRFRIFNHLIILLFLMWKKTCHDILENYVYQLSKR
jgi:hypothetical protein